MRIAVTGKMGSGKSEVLKALKSKGRFTLSADEVYSELLLSDKQFVLDISNAMGVKPVTVNGVLTIDRKAISEKVFSDKFALDKLNNLTHPKIMKEMLSRSESVPVAFLEIPLLSAVPEYEKYFDKVIIVVRESDKIIKGVKQRDGLSPSDIKKRLSFQSDYIINSEIEHTFIYNDGDLPALYKKVEALEKTL